MRRVSKRGGEGEGSLLFVTHTHVNISGNIYLTSPSSVTFFLIFMVHWYILEISPWFYSPDFSAIIWTNPP